VIEAIAMDEKRTGLGWNFHSNPGPCASSWRCSLQVSFPRPTNLLDSVRNLRALDSPAIFRQKKSDVPTSAWAAPHLHVTSGFAKDPRTISSGIRLAVDVSGSARRGPVCENTSGVCLAGGCVLQGSLVSVLPVYAVGATIVVEERLALPSLEC